MTNLFLAIKILVIKARASTKTLMTMMFRKVSIILSFTLLSLSAVSQEKDFGIWYGVSAEHKLLDKLELGMSTCIRTFDKGSKIEEAFIDGGLSFKIIKQLSVAGYYRFTWNHEDDGSFKPRHKWYFDIKSSVDIGDFQVSGRFRFQERFKTYFEDENDKIPVFHGRYRLKTTYKTPSFPVNPYLSAEIFNPLFRDIGKKIDKERYIGGIEYKLSGNHSFELEYIFQRDYHPDLRYDNIVSVNYNLKF